MKIICIGRNYVEHIEELNNEKPDEPIIFTKPDTALLRKGDPFFYPEISKDIHHEIELVIKINKIGKNIHERFAGKYFDEIGLGIDFTARDLQSKAKEKGLPWVLAKGFDGSAPVSNFLPVNHFKNLRDINFHLSIDGEIRQKGNSGLMLFSFEEIIAYVSRFITLKQGDLIFTGTPKGVGSIKIGNRLEGYIEDQKMLDIAIK